MSQRIIGLLLASIVFFAIWGGIIFGVYCLIKRLIRYNAECQDRYARRWQAEQDLDDLETEVNHMKDHDWSKEPPER